MRLWGVLCILLMVATAVATTSTPREIDPQTDASEDSADADDFDDDWATEDRAEIVTPVTLVRAGERIAKLQHLAVSGIDRPPCIRPS